MSLMAVCAQAQNDSVTSIKEQELDDITVVARRAGTVKSRGLMNTATINGGELVRAACCNLGESFSTNPSVDVSYPDAATGSRQIKLLGLAGNYVQLLSENTPDYRGAAARYALGYIPGPWMESIQVSKGAASVKNGYESVTGQINVTLKQPEAEEFLNLNAYGNIMGKMDVNADRNIHISHALSTNMLLHFEENFGDHDNNGDGFTDEARVRQLNLRNAWVYKSGAYIMHASVNALWEKRRGGQTGHGTEDGAEQFMINTQTARYNITAKNAIVLDSKHNANIALILSATMHRTDAEYGLKSYGVNQKDVYASLMFETEMTKAHRLSMGLSFNHDYYGQSLQMPELSGDGEWTGPVSDAGAGNERENTPGIYAQYTLNLDDKLVAMAGVRADHSSMYGTFVTPRAHIKFAPSEAFTVRASIGKGYRTAHALAENNYMLASGRRLVIDKLEQEEAWNCGVSASLYIPLSGRTLNINAEYYYTKFNSQAIADYDTDPQEIRITNLDGKSFSSTWQVDATYPLADCITLTAAFRRTNVKTTCNGKLMDKLLTNKYKGLLTASYKTPLGLWQIDATLQLNGPGRLPYSTADGTQAGSLRYGSYEQLSAQVTRWFRHFSIYIGGENLTDFKQDTPIINASSPWSTGFEPTLVWGPVQGAMAYAGIKIRI